jgi:hypothetical protein
MEEEQPTAAAVDISAEEETLPEAEAQPAMVEETLPDAKERPMMAEGEDRPDEEERPAKEREADPAAASQNLQIPSWNLEERISFVPQEWDADTPQLGVGAADDGVEIIDLEELEQLPLVADPPRRSPAETRARRRKKPTHRKKKGRFILRLRETSSVHTAEATEDEGRPTQTADNFASQPVQEAREDAVLATEVASVPRQEDPVPGTEEVRSTDGRERVPAPVDTLAESHVQAAQGTHNPAETERNTALLSSQSSPASTAARRMSATRPVGDQRDEILAILGTAMDRVRAWKGPADAQQLATAEVEVATLQRQLANCEEVLKLKVLLLTEAEKGQAELRRALVAKEAELVAVRQEVAEERRRSTDADYLRGKLRNAEADLRSLQRRNGILRSDFTEASSSSGGSSDFTED